MVLFITYSNQTISEKFKMSIKTKVLRIAPSLYEFKYLTSTCWNEKIQPLTIDMTKNKYCGRYQLRLNSIFVPNSSPF